MSRPLTREAVQAEELHVGDDVLDYAGGRMTVAVIEPAPHGMYRIVSTRGRERIVSPYQLYGRYVPVSAEVERGLQIAAEADARWLRGEGE
jgi:hypothetical protein